MSVATAPPRPPSPTGRDGFGAVLHAEWTKFRTVRAWMVTSVVAALLIVAFSALNGSLSKSTVCAGPTQACTVGHPTVPIGPGGEPVDDTFEFAHQPLTGNGTITVEVTSLAGLIAGDGGRVRAGAAFATARPGLEAWAKAGLIITSSTAQGAPYAAVMATGGYGVRMQWDFTNDVAGLPGRVTTSSPRWLRLTRTGDSVTADDSRDGVRWSRVGTATVPGLPVTVQAGLFATSPLTQVTVQHLAVTSGYAEPSQVTAVFQSVSAVGSWPAGTWTVDTVGGGPGAGTPGVEASAYRQSGGQFTLTGVGNIAPTAGDGGGQGPGLGATLSGAFIALILVLVLGVLFVTSEYRRGMIRTTLAASPRRGRVLVAKAIVIAGVTFVAALAGGVAAAALGPHLLRENGNYVAPVSLLTAARVVAGTAAVLALCAVFALGLGSIMRRSAGAITAASVILLVPTILGVSILPPGPAEWMLALTPAAGFAIQQTAARYTMVSYAYTPANGYYPLPPWAGLAVLALWAAAVLWVAIVLLARRDT